MVHKEIEGGPVAGEVSSDSNIDRSTDSLDGTEYEDAGITRPFNPTLIKIDTQQMSLDTLIKRIREKEIDLSPDFQRAEVWGATARSRLIESLLIRIPLPAFYMDASDENHWLVVDGLQRLSTLRDFVINRTMILQNLEFLTEYHGKGYSDLPRLYQRRIEETQVTIYQIGKGTPSDVKFNIFKRINTGGLPLSTQEIRHALNQGPVTQYLKLLANSNEFRLATDNSVKDNRMAARECVLRFLAFTITPPSAYKAGDFDAFLSEAMHQLNKMSELDRTRLAGRFNRALIVSHRVFGKEAFRKPRSGAARLPVNKALFEVWTVTMDSITDEQVKIMDASRIDVCERISSFMRKDSDFMNAISQGTGDTAKVVLRFGRFRKAIEEAIDAAKSAS